MGEKGEGSGGKGGGNWEWGAPLSTPSIKAPQFYTALGLKKNSVESSCKWLNSRPLSVFQVLFKANFISKDFSRQSCIFKYFSNQCEP